MNSRTRLFNAIKGEPIDRVPVKMWGIHPWQEPPHESYRPLFELAWESDPMPGWGPKGMPLALNAHPDISVHQESRPSKHAGHVEDVAIIEAPGKRFESVSLRSTDNRPGMISQHFISTPEQMQAFLDLPFKPFQPDVEDFFIQKERLGDKGLLMAMLPADPIYQLQILLGSEALALWSMDHRDLVRQFIASYGERWHEYAAYLLEQDLGPLFGYVGPELGIPPLMSLRDFEEFVWEVEKPVLDRIHAAGCYAWVHCHGRMRLVIERFADMGVDCLNPIEPPPMGDITLPEAKELVGDRMTLEGNVEIGDFADLEPEAFREVCIAAMEAGKPGGRFIFCQSADPSHWPELPPRVLENYRIFLEVGREYGRY